MDILSLKPYEREGKAFVEFFIHDRPLSEILDEFYHSKASLLERGLIGVLGSSKSTQAEIIKLKQLLNKKISDKEIRSVYPSTWTDKEFDWYLHKYRDELANPEILIYCCSACGDYDCGGIAVTIDRTETSVIWKLVDDRDLSFEFEKYNYFEVLNNRIQYLGKKERSAGNSNETLN